jgi:hypothetical protein
MEMLAFLKSIWTGICGSLGGRGAVQSLGGRGDKRKIFQKRDRDGEKKFQPTIRRVWNSLSSWFTNYFIWSVKRTEGGYLTNSGISLT